MPTDDIHYEARLPQHMPSKHRFMAIVRTPGHTDLRAIATIGEALTATRLADALNSRLGRNLTERLDMAVTGLPQSVHATIHELPLRPGHPGRGQPPLAAHARTDPLDGIRTFPTTSCTPGTCDRCSDCTNDCFACPICHSTPCQHCLPPDLTPRTAQALAVAGTLLADDCYNPTTRNQPVSDRDRAFLPLPELLRNQGVEFLRLIARAFDDLAAELDDGLQPRPRSMAEHVALHLIIDRANALHTDQPDLLDTFGHDLPETPYDYDFHVLYDLLFEDTDYLELLDPVDIPAAPGTLDALFDPLHEDDDRDPDRGFRR